MNEHRRILAVDDQPINLAVLKKVLAGFKLETAVDGYDCLKKIDAFRPQLVLLDVMMPGLSGLEVCRRIKGQISGEFVQVILVSAKGSTEERLEGYACQADDYLAKPFSHDELLCKVHVQFRLWDAHRELVEAKRQLQQQADDLAERVAERTRDVIAGRDVTVFALAQLAESRDFDTGDHLLRMRNYAQLLAEELRERGTFGDEIDERFLDDLRRSSPLHDVGKVGIGDHILLHPGKLTAEQFEQMKRHVLIGAETLEKARDQNGGEFLAMAVDIARYHHERFDGTGYLEGLKGDEIPLAARIVALADVYDALSSARVYKPAYSPDVVWNIINQSSGTHFDPRIVDAFRARHEDFLAIREALVPVTL